MGIFIKTITFISGMVAAVTGLIISGNFFNAVWDALADAGLAVGDAADFMNYAKLLFAASAITLVVSVVIWYFVAVSQREYELDELMMRRYKYE